MVATLTKASPVADFTLGEFIVAPPTAKLLDDETPELDCSPQFIQEKEILEAVLPLSKPAAATRTDPDAAAAITDLVAAAVLLALFAGAFLTIGEYARDVYDKLANFSPFELFRFFNFIP